MNARQWIVQMGIAKESDSKDEWNAKTKAYRDSLANREVFGTAWAERVVRRWKAGRYEYRGHPVIAGYRMACAVLGVQMEPYGEREKCPF